MNINSEKKNAVRNTKEKNYNNNLTPTKSYFEKVDLNINFPEMEKKILEHWYKDGIVNKYLHKNDKSDKYFSFLDGPITANNPMGVHHAWGRTYKDLWQRHFNMKGYQQRFQNGFDCQGLWVEVEVEKELGIKSKRDIENLIPGDRKASIEKFVQLCKDRVKKYSDIQTEQSKRLGYFADWDNSYFTLSENNNYMIWRFLKVCYDNGWIYKGNDVVPWCPRCETAISQHEILTEDYKEVTHKSVYFRFPIIGRNKEYLLIWTTTPWTIPANTAVAVDINIDYICVEDNGNKYWLAENLSDTLFGKDKKVIAKQKGVDLIGMKYTSPFDDLPCYQQMSDNDRKLFHSVVATDPMIMPITTEEGTGLVHTSTSTGEEDHRLGVKLGLTVIPAIDDKAYYLDDYGYLKGKNAKENPDIILNILEERGNIFKIFPYKHRYPACWRCKEELVWKVTDEWYIAMDCQAKSNVKNQLLNVENKTLRERMMEVTKQINWIPEFGLERELDWLKNMNDWLISKKNRFWGLALPIWECDCGYFEVIGSYEELKEKTIEGWSDFVNKTPHKPQIDEIKIKCKKCNNLMSRIEPVGNPWLDAGIVAYSTVSANNQATLFENSSENPLYVSDRKEWEKWIPADFITESFPGQFKNWFYSLIAMSTVLENIPPFKNVLGYATLLAEDGTPMHKSAGNMITFDDGAEKIGVDVARWMYVRQNPTENLLFGYNVSDEVRRKFHLKIWNIYNFLVTYANIDKWVPEKSYGEDIPSQKNILDRWIVSRLSIVYKSVLDCLDNFMAYHASLIIEEFLDDFSNWYIRRSRGRISSANNDSTNDKRDFYQTTYWILIRFCELLAPFVPYISDYIYSSITKKQSVHLAEWFKNIPSPDDELILEMNIVRMLAEKAHSIRKEKAIPVRQPLNKMVTDRAKIQQGLEFILKDEINVKTIIWGGKKSGDYSLELDINLTPDLIEEAKTRELIRNIQKARKELGVSRDQLVIVQNNWYPSNQILLKNLCKITLVKKMVNGSFKVIKDS